MSRPSTTSPRAFKSNGTESRRLDRIESDNKDPRWAKLFLEGVARSVARLPRESLTELRIRDGMNWTPAVAKRVRQFVAHREAREYSMSLLAKSTQNGATLAQRLDRKGYDADLVAKTIAELKSDGWLNDDTHATIRASSVSRSRRGLSVDSLSQLLESEGIDQVRASREGRRVAGTPQAKHLAIAMAREALANRGKKHPLTVAGALLHRGMDADTIRSALRQEGIDFDE